jgi:MFS superfamily sulfate permease-like transporter
LRIARKVCAYRHTMSGFIRGCGVLIILRSLTNFAKLFQGDGAVLVMFGQILHGTQVLVPAAVIGMFMLVTGTAMLIGSRSAAPLIAVYALYVAINLVAWTVTNPDEIQHVGRRLSSASDPTTLWWIGAAGFLGYCIVALGTTALPACLLRHRPSWWRRGSQSS